MFLYRSSLIWVFMHCLPKKLLKHFSKQQKQATFVVTDALRVNTGKRVTGAGELCRAYVHVYQELR